jgi:hypothetical protein
MSGKQQAVLVLSSFLAIAILVQQHFFRAVSEAMTATSIPDIGARQFGLSGATQRFVFLLGFVLVVTWIAGLSDDAANFVLLFVLLAWMLDFFKTGGHVFTPV